MLRKFIAYALAVLAPTVMLSGQTGTAVLYGTGSVYLNGAQLSNSSAVTTGDVIQTKESGAANLNGVGVSVVIQSNTIVRSQTGGLSPDRGSVSVATGNGFSVFARDFKIVPTSSAWTEFYISRASGVIQIIARKNGISISCGPTTSTLPIVESPRSGLEQCLQRSHRFWRPRRRKPLELLPVAPCSAGF